MGVPSSGTVSACFFPNRAEALPASTSAAARVMGTTRFTTYLFKEIGPPV